MMGVSFPNCMVGYLSGTHCKNTAEGIKNLRQSGGLREIHDFASPPRGGFAISDGIELGIQL
jgi:hypothetical protein